MRWLALALALAATGCGRGPRPDTAPVLLTEGVAMGQPWRLEGRRLQGSLCVSLSLPGVEQPPVARCGIRRTELRHLDPVSAPVVARVLVFSALPARARRVRVDETDGTILVEPARQAPGFPGRFFLVDLGFGQGPEAVRVFADGGRAVVG